MDATIARAVKKEPVQDDLASPSIRAPTKYLMSDVQIPGPETKEEASKEDADCPGVSRDIEEDGTPTPSHAGNDSSESTSTFSALSSEEALVQSLQLQAQEAAAQEQRLQAEVDLPWRQMEDYRQTGTEFRRTRLARWAELATLYAQRRELEATTKRERGDYDELKDKETKSEHLANIKWQAGNRLKRDADEAAKQRRNLERELKEARYEDELCKQFSDPGFRQFVRNITDDKARHRLLNDATTDDATITDLPEIDIMLERAIEVVKDEFKSKDEPAKTGMSNLASLFLYCF